MAIPRKTYIGDGVYARWDGLYVVLTTSSGGTENRVYLDAPVLEALATFLRALNEGLEVAAASGSCAICGQGPALDYASEHRSDCPYWKEWPEGGPE
jgi:hypothetical protein